MKKSFIILVMALCTTLSAAAQTSASLRTGYFQDRMYMRHTLNPALVNDFNYLAFPVLGGIGMGFNTNLGLNDFLFPSATDDSVLNTFLNSEVSNDEFLKGLNKLNTVSQSFDMELFGLGFYGFGGFNTLGISLHEEASLVIPQDFFMLMKGGQSTYDLSNFGVNLNSYAQVAFGHARKINEKITVGVKLKALVGLAYIDFHTDNTVLTMSDDEWKFSADGGGSIAALGMVFDLDDEDNLSYDEDAMPSIGGLGAAIDLGASYEFNKNLTFSLAVTDLGFISWRNVSSIGITGGETTLLNYSDRLDMENLSDTFSDRLDGVSDDITEMMEVSDVETGNVKSVALAATITAGVEYSIWNDRVSLGLLSTTKFGTTTFAELMAVLDLNPLKCFEFSFSGAVSTVGNYWGALFNFCPRGFVNFYLGTDCMITKVTPQMVPVNATNVNFRMGMAIPLGGKKEHLDKHLN